MVKDHVIQLFTETRSLLSRGNLDYFMPLFLSFLLTRFLSDKTSWNFFLFVTNSKYSLGLSLGVVIKGKSGF